MRASSRFRADVAGAAAVEFCFEGTYLAFLCLAGFDFGQYVVASQRVEAVSYSIAQMLSQTAPSTAAVDSGDGVVSDATLQWYHNSAMITFPQVLTASSIQQIAWDTLLSINMTSIRFTPTPAGSTSSCTYTPKVIWTTGNRPCNTTFTAAASTAPPSPTTLPSDLYGPDSQIVIDISYTFNPSVGAEWLPPMTLARTTYMSPRDVPMVETTSTSTLAPLCPGVL